MERETPRLRRVDGGWCDVDCAHAKHKNSTVIDVFGLIEILKSFLIKLIMQGLAATPSGNDIQSTHQKTASL